jgi:hypothetical protein
VSHGGTTALLNVQDLLDRMVERPGGRLYPLAVGLTVIGVVGFIAGVMSDPSRAWAALVWNWALWSGVSTGGAILVAASTIASGHWIRSLRRLAESLTAFMPVSYVIMIVLFFGLGHVYSWVEHPPEAKVAYLNPRFFVLRQLVAVGAVYLMSLSLVYWSLRPDLGRLKERIGGWRRGLYDRLTRNWQGLDIELERSIYKRERLAPAVVLVWAAGWTVWAWDWLMSIDPHWFSTLFGAWMFMTYFLAAIGVTAVLATFVRRYRSFVEIIDQRSLHDIGKMLFAFTIFWTYLFFAQYLVIWYGRLPEETHFIEQRLWSVYQPIAIIVLAGVFLIPFIGLLGVKPKRTPALLRTFATISLIGIWFFHLLIIGPGVLPDSIALGPIELAVAVGVLGAFMLTTMTFFRAIPSIAIAAGLPPDPETEKLAELTEPHHH